MIKTITSLILCLLSTGSVSALEVGETAPDFTLPGSDGQNHQFVRLSRASGCARVVSKSLPQAAERSNVNHSVRVTRRFLSTTRVLFMASVDDIETNTAFAKKNNASFPVLSDAEKNVALAYEVMSPLGFSKRWTYYIGTDGEILKNR